MSLAAIRSITLKTGEVVELPQDGITVIVGPNNSGKSLLLRNIAEALNAGGMLASNQHNWLQAIDVYKNPDTSVLHRWLEPWTRIALQNTQFPGEPVIPRYPGHGTQEQIRLQDLAINWLGTSGLEPLSQWLSVMLDAGSRLQIGSLRGEGTRDPLHPPQNAMERLWDDQDLEYRISALIKRAFGFEVCVNRYSPQTNGLLIGSPYREPEPLPPRREFLEELAALDSLVSQGDGVRSFAGILMSTMVYAPPVVFIDEPEAFLHPPQAKLLGRYLVQETDPTSQIVVATHSTDILHGILSSNSGRPVQLIRVSTDHVASVLPNSEVSSLWSDALLKYSRMLDGLVHQGMAICESDADCQFYSAVLDARFSSDHDVLFTHVNGKARFPEAAARLHRLGLKPAIVADIDILNDVTLLKRLVTAVNGNWQLIEAPIRLVLNEISTRANYPTAKALKDAIPGLSSRLDTDRISDAEADRLKDALKRDSGWKSIKATGVRSLRGEPLAALEQVLEHLLGLGIFVVPIGELESWEPAIAGHGPSFVRGFLEAGHHRESSRTAPSRELDEFMFDLARHVGMDPRDMRQDRFPTERRHNHHGYKKERTPTPRDFIARPELEED